MSLKIPDRYRPGFVAIINLADGSLVELLTALSDISPSLAAQGPKRLAATINTKGLSLSERDISNIIATVVSLYVARADREATVADFAEDICQAIERSQDEKLQLSTDNRERFKQRLIQLLSFDSFSVGAKAFDVSHEYEHALCSLRILTDMRPVFGDEPEQLPAAAVIVHTLKIVYHHGDQLKEFFVSFDAKQLGVLRKLLDRAEAKAASLKSILSRAGVHYLDKEHLE